jgi:hypothetical protein
MVLTLVKGILYAFGILKVVKKLSAVYILLHRFLSLSAVPSRYAFSNFVLAQMGS